MGKLLNFQYSCIQGTFWMYYGIVGTFASVFLLARGYSNSEIGVVLAVGNVLAVVLQPLLADIADRSKKISLTGIIQILVIIMMVLTVALCAIQKKSLALTVIFVLLLTWHTVLQPLINSLSFKLAESGYHVSFGVARSIGSLCYAALMAVMGTLVENHGVQVLPISGEVILLMLLVSLILTKKQYDRAKTDGQPGQAIEENAAETAAEEEINLKDFVMRNKIFVLVNVGVIGIYFSNQILNNYMIQIVTSVGGDSEDMGRILSVMAFLEIPAMVGFDSLRKKFSCELLLKVASVGFAVKIAMCYIATSVTMVYIAQFFQLISFGLFLPAMVNFIDEIMSKGEAVKGQAFFTTMVTVTSMISSLIGGVILDLSGAKMLTLVATVATALGALIIIASVDRIGKKNA